jgi:hypothetical protein
VRLDFRSRPFPALNRPVEVVVGSLASTSHWGPCGSRFCYVPSRIYGYTPR